MPLANFAGWVVVGRVIAGDYDLLSRRAMRGSPRGEIGEFVLAGTGILLHALVFLVLWSGRAGARARSAKTTFTYERIS